MSTPKKREVKAIQINVALGPRPRVEIFVDRRVTRDLSRQPAEYHRDGLTRIEEEVADLINQLGNKIYTALRQHSETITVLVDGKKILPDPPFHVVLVYPDEV